METDENSLGRDPDGRWVRGEYVPGRDVEGFRNFQLRNPGDNYSDFRRSRSDFNVGFGGGYMRRGGM